MTKFPILFLSATALFLLIACATPPGAAGGGGLPGEALLEPVDSSGWGSIQLNGVKTKVRWSDGDSFKIRDGAYEGSGVRLVGFNTLESYGPVHRWGSWSAVDLYALAAASKNYAAAREWTCTTSGEKEGYGRLLIDCPDAAEAMILVGHAHAFSMEGEAATDLLGAQERAQRARRGIWAKGVPQSIVTSLHSSDEGKRGGYNRSVSSSSGESSVREHRENYAVCEEVCEEGGSCLVYVPFAQRYRNKPDCLK